MGRKKVIVAGHICIDITPAFPDKHAVNLTDILSPGKLIEVGQAHVNTGGAVANTGLAMKALGADVSLMGKIGDDAFGGMIRSILREYDADEGLLVAENEGSSYTIVVAVPGNDRFFLHNPGTNNTFRASDVPEDALTEAALFHFGYPPLMRAMYEKDGEELIQLMKKAKEAGTATSLDLAAVDPSSSAGQADWAGILKRVMPYVDFFVPSIEELCYMIAPDRLQEWEMRAAGRDLTEILDVDRDVRPLADLCMEEYGPKILLLKCGAQGMYYRTADCEKLGEISSRMGLEVEEWAGREGFERSFVPDQVLSATGAGDTSIAAFLLAALEGYSPQRAVQLAAATGACCVAAYDALSGLKSFAQLEEKIAAGWKKQTEETVGSGILFQ